VVSPKPYAATRAARTPNPSVLANSSKVTSNESTAEPDIATRREIGGLPKGIGAGVGR